MALATGESGVCGVLGNRREPGAQQGREAPPLPGAPRAPRPERTDCYFPPRRSPAADGRPRRCGHQAGAAAPAHVLILKEVRAPAGRPRQKRGREPGPGGPCARHLKGAPRREQGGRGRGSRQKFAAT